MVPSLYCPNFTIDAFSQGLHMCMSSDLNSYYYTNAILQQNQEKLETNLFAETKPDAILTYFLVNLVLAPLFALFQGVYICACDVI